MSLVKSFEEACQVKGLDPEKVIPVTEHYPAEHAKALIAAAKLFIIVSVVNEDWKPDWTDYDESKYYPWFDLEKEEANPSGFRLYGVNWYCTLSTVGSRLCFRSRETAEHVAKHFEDLYRDLMVLE